jgi:acyl-CoA dehydrogenase
MPVFKAPVDDTLFILNDVFGYERYSNLPGFADASPDIVEAILREGAQVLRGGAAAAQPERRSGRLQPPRRRQRIDAEGLQGSLQAISAKAVGWGSRHPPNSAARACRTRCMLRLNEYMSSANMSFAMYPGLTAGARSRR